MKKITPLFVSLIFSSLASEGNTGEINQRLIDELSAFFSMPTDEIVVEDLRYSLDYKKFDFLVALQFQSEEQKYAEISLAVGRHGDDSLLEMAKIFKSNSSLPPEHPSHGIVKKKVFENGMISYWGFGIFGPGGEETAMFIEWPSKSIKIFCKLSVPGDPPIESNGNNREHLKIIDKGIDEIMAERLTRVFEKTFSEHSPNNTQSGSALNFPKEPQTPPINQSESSKNNVEDQPLKEAVEQTSKPSANWIWIIAGVLMVGFLFFLLKTWKGKSPH